MIARAPFTGRSSLMTHRSCRLADAAGHADVEFGGGGHAASGGRSGLRDHFLAQRIQCAGAGASSSASCGDGRCWAAMRGTCGLGLGSVLGRHVHGLHGGAVADHRGQCAGHDVAVAAVHGGVRPGLPAAADSGSHVVGDCGGGCGHRLDVWRPAGRAAAGRLRCAGRAAGRRNELVPVAEGRGGRRHAAGRAHRRTAVDGPHVAFGLAAAGRRA